VAIKTCAKKMVNKRPILKELMESELEVLRTSSHPHVLKAVELLEDESYYYIASELLNGGELEDYLEKLWSSGRSLREDDAAHIIQQMLQALNYMHSFPLIHRDLKP